MSDRPVSAQRPAESDEAPKVGHSAPVPSLRELRDAPWRAPALALISTSFSALILLVNEEVDAYAPAFIGLGIWTLWRCFHGWLSTLLTAPWVCLAAGLIFERALPHQRYIVDSAEWAPVSMSLTLTICSTLLILSIPLRALDVWLHRA